MKYLSIFYVYNEAKDKYGDDPYTESYTLTFDNLKDAIISIFKDAEASEDCVDYGGAVVVDETKKLYLNMFPNGNWEFNGGNEVIKIVEEYLQRDFSQEYNRW